MIHAFRFLIEMVWIALILKACALKIKLLQLKVSILRLFLLVNLSCNFYSSLFIHDMLFNYDRCGENSGLGFKSPLYALFRSSRKRRQT